MRNSLVLAAVLGFLCVALGAFAAHGLSDPRAQGWMRTGAEYGFVHVLASLACLPLMQAGARRAGFAPPFFLAHGTADRFVPPAQSTSLAAALEAAGTDVELLLIEDADHMWVLPDHSPAAAEKAMDATVDFFLRQAHVP